MRVIRVSCLLPPTLLSLIIYMVDGFQPLLSSPRKSFPSRVSLHVLTAVPSPWQGFLSRGTKTQNNVEDERIALVELFVQAYSSNDPAVVDKLVIRLDKDCELQDYRFSKTFTGVEEVERHLRLQAESINSPLKIDQFLVEQKQDSLQRKIGILFCAEQGGGQRKATSRGVAWFELVPSNSDNPPTIAKIIWTVESTSKGGEDSLRLLTAASKVLKAIPGTKNDIQTNFAPSSVRKAATAPEQYFQAWNRRDMQSAVNLFTDTVTYDDTAFPKPFSGKDALQRHLLICADAFPSSFTFEMDDLIQNGDRIMTLWHVEDNGKPLPFTRGISVYTLDSSNGKIQDGIDFVEPGPIKMGGIDLFVRSMTRKLKEEPARVIPLAVWIAYMYIVFFSDGILPGANALQLEQRTWEEVRDLSLNFFLVSPLLNLPFSPVVHPMLEGVFNLLLSWAAMFAGFFSDDRKDKPNLLPMIPIVVGMQLLTSAVLLPYLATRSTERRDNVCQEDLTAIAQICESRALGAAMGFVGTGAIVWAFLGRYTDFGGLEERWSTFVDLLSIDRVGSSFIVDLVIFGLFQAWLVDDDMKRRGMEPGSKPLASLAKYVPFFGMASYLTLRPTFPSGEEKLKR